MKDDYFAEGDYRTMSNLPPSVLGWNPKWTQTEKGKMNTIAQVFKSGPLLMTNTYQDKSFICTGEAPADMRAFIFRIESNTPYRVYGKEMGYNDMLVVPVSRELDFVSQGHRHNASVSLTNDALEQLATSWEADQMLRRLNAGGTFRAPLKALQELRKIIEQLQEVSASDCESIPFDNIREDIISAFGACLESNYQVNPNITPTSRYRAVRKAVECIKEGSCESITLATLCKAADVSERTLHYAFKQHMGISPKAFLKRFRLNQVRDALHNGEAGNVTQAALQSGFWHMGQFSADYKKFFGELPSETLRQQPTGIRFMVPPAYKHVVGI